MGAAPHSSLLNDAVEMAVLSSVSHPNIVQRFACMPHMAKVHDDGEGGRGRGECLGRPHRASRWRSDPLSAPPFEGRRLCLSPPPLPLLVGPRALASLDAAHPR
jgi:hypothetical protein